MNYDAPQSELQNVNRILTCWTLAVEPAYQELNLYRLRLDMTYCVVLLTIYAIPRYAAGKAIQLGEEGYQKNVLLRAIDLRITQFIMMP